MKRRLGAVAVAGLAALTTLASCNLYPRGCTEAGADSGVFFGDIAGSGAFPPGVGEAGEEPVYHVVVQPNGPHCPPTAFQGWVAPTRGGTLVPVAVPQ